MAAALAVWAVVTVARLSGDGAGDDVDKELGAWTAIETAPLAPRISASIVWTGHELVLWGGRACTRGRCDDPSAPVFGDGAAFNPGTGTWRPLSPSPLSPRSGAVSAWSGREMLMWGGMADGPQVDGAAYDPATDRWRPFGTIAPAGGGGQAVWSGRELLVWTGVAGSASAVYDPVADRWRPTRPSPLTPRADVTIVWTGREMIVWGGTDGTRYFADGAAYDPVADDWRTLSDAPLAGRVVRGTWTGREVLIWGGEGSGEALDDGAAWDPATNRWRPMGPAPLGPRRGFATVWTGQELLVWGGAGATGSSVFGDGAAYDPAADRWRRIARWPGRFIPSAVWTGQEMLVVAGIVPAGAGTAAGVEPAVDGARYRP